MSKYTIYHNPRCTKSRETLALLEEAKVDFGTVMYLEVPPSRDELVSLSDALAMRPIEFTRTGEAEFKEWFKSLEAELEEQGVEGTLKVELLDDEMVFDLLAENSKLIERPIVVRWDGDKMDAAIIGRPPETVKVLLED